MEKSNSLKEGFISSINKLKDEISTKQSEILELETSIQKKTQDYLKVVSKFKKNDIVYKTDYTYLIYYKVISIKYSLAKNKILYTLEPLRKGRAVVIEEEDNLILRDHYKGCLHNKKRILDYMKVNTRLRYTEVAEYFNVPYDTIVRYAKELNIRKNARISLKSLVDYLKDNPNATVRNIAFNLKISESAVRVYVRRYNLHLNIRKYSNSTNL